MIGGVIQVEMFLARDVNPTIKLVKEYNYPGGF